MDLILTVIFLVAVFAAVGLSMAFGWPTVPSVKSSDPAGYATAMDQNDSSSDRFAHVARNVSKRLDGLLGTPVAKDPTGFTEDERFQHMMSLVRDIAEEYDVSQEFVVASLECAVSGDDLQ